MFQITNMTEYINSETSKEDEPLDKLYNHKKLAIEKSYSRRMQTLDLGMTRPVLYQGAIAAGQNKIRFDNICTSCFFRSSI
jgi:hypothetical protein